MAAAWPPGAAARAGLRARMAENLSRICFFGRAKLPSMQHAVGAVEAVEMQAHAFAEASHRTTTGTREPSETMRLYMRKLGELLVEAARAAQTKPAADEGPADAGVFDVSGGAREFVTGPAARTRFEPAFQNAAYHTIKLGNKSYDVEAAAIIAEACAANPLHTLDMADILAGRPEDEAMNVLNTIARGVAAGCNLKAVDVSDNALGEKGVRALAPLLSSQRQLATIKFQNNGISAAAAAAIAELLTCPEELREVHLHNNMTGDEGAAAVAGLVAKAPRLSALRMTATRVGEDGGRAVLEALAAAPAAALERLELTDNMLGEDNGVALARVALVHGATLRRLLVGDTGIGARGVAAVCLALRRGGAPQLEELDLAQNEVGPQGAARVVAAVGGARTLARLGLSDNAELGDRGAAVLADALGAGAFPGLARLDVSRSGVRAASKETLARAAADRGAELVCERDEDDDDDDDDDEELNEEEVDDDEVAAELGM